MMFACYMIWRSLLVLWQGYERARVAGLTHGETAGGVLGCEGVRAAGCGAGLVTSGPFEKGGLFIAR